MISVTESPMTTATMVPVDVYLSSMYDPDCDYVDGEVQERNVGETPHSLTQKFLMLFFGTHERDWGVRILPEVRVQISMSRYRVADLCVVKRSTGLEPIIRTPPLVCIEVLSPEDRMSRTQEKVDDYIAMGVQCVWVIDPRRRRVFVADRSVTLQLETEFLTVAGTDIKVPVGEIFSELDEMEAS
jgi:Uma2 family endonuclease